MATASIKVHRTRPWVTYTIILCCILVFIHEASIAHNSTINGQVLYQLGSTVPTKLHLNNFSLLAIGQVLVQAITNVRFWSAMWLHGSIFHITSNMIFLLITGRWLEPVMGHIRFLVLYLLSGFIGDITASVFAQEYSMGASTALFGLLIGGYVIAGKLRQRQLQHSLLDTFMVNIVLDLAMPDISLWGHLGGALAGFCLGWNLLPNQHHNWEDSLLFQIPFSLLITACLIVLISLAH